MITSSSNPRLKLVRRLQARRAREKLGLFVCEGEDVVAAALDAGLEPVEALVDPERPALVDRLRAAEPVAPELLAQVSALGHGPRVMAVFRRADLPDLAVPEVGLALWGIGDPGNVGTLVRAADALGPAYVALSEGCADPCGPKALRASMGSVFRVALVGFDEARGRRLALVAHGGGPLAEADLSPPLALVLGAEREGVPDEVLAACDAHVTIPLTGAESLNVAMAGAIALYELARRRASAG